MYEYSASFKNQLDIFETSLPFAGGLDRTNRWITLSKLINWKEFEKIYAQTFSKRGRSGIKARIVIGALILKHKLELSDREIAQQLTENPYLQIFIGLNEFTTISPFDSSTLTNVRKRMGENEFEKFEIEIIKELQKKKLIKPKGFLVDATVIESEITFPTDCGLLNKVRKFLVENIKNIGKTTNKKMRTYCRKAQKEYLNFNKKRKKTKKQIRRMQKSLLQYVRRNIKQMKELTAHVQESGVAISKKIVDKFELAKKIYKQQKTMYDNKVKTIESRIVSFHKDYVRPMVRGKSGKNVEFGSKVSMAYVDGYLFVDQYSTDSFNESKYLKQSVDNFKERFNKKPNYVAMDNIYGTRENRKYLNDEKIKTSVKALGRKRLNQSQDKDCRWRRSKQKERNRIEGAFGHVKSKYLLGKVRAKLPETEYSWLRMALLSHNLVTASKRA